MRIIDLSREIYHRTPSYPGQPPIIQADMARFRQEVGEPQARDITAGLRGMAA